ncbi:MAG: hypothetical protein KKA76_18020 [Proteobacteria bacterium]|nr:hypothetical protein [Pseudomonadota bacterium]
MTAQNSLSVSLTPAAAGTDDVGRFVTLEQVAQPISTEYADLYSIYRMFLRAIDGIPAHIYKPQDCPIGFEGELVHIWLDFYVMPSSMDLKYELSASIGDIGVAEIVELPRERDIVFAMTDFYDLGFFPLAADLAWQTGCYTKDGMEVGNPPLILSGSRITLPQDLFGVARMEALAWAKLHRLHISIDKAGNRVSNLKSPVVTAAWRNSDGEYVTEQLELIVPACVTMALSLCDGDGANTYCSAGNALPVTVYYSTCDGSVVSVRPGADPESWCADVAA